MPEFNQRSIAILSVALLCFSCNLVSLQPSLLAASVEYDETIPQLQLAAQEIADALKEAGTAQSGVDDIRLLLNGVRVGKPTSKSSNIWKASKFPELANLQEDWYSLKVIAVDEKGFVVDKEIYVSVGNHPGEKEDWILQPYVVLMADGQELLSGRGDTDEEMEDDEYERNIDGIDVKFQFDNEGKLTVRDMFYRVFEQRTMTTTSLRDLPFPSRRETNNKPMQNAQVIAEDRCPTEQTNTPVIRDGQGNYRGPDPPPVSCGGS